jgi:heavy metal translocating P-type ATPase
MTRRGRAALVPAAALLFILSGLLLWISGDARWSEAVWLVGLAVTGIPTAGRTLVGIVRGRVVADIVAMLAIITALLLAQPLAGLVVVLMQTGGEALERYAEGRASEAVRALEAAAPHLAHRLGPGGEIVDVAAEAVRVGDRLLVRPGELVPCDVVVLEGRSHVDVSRLTGEPVPVTAEPGTKLSSGSLNGEAPLTVEAKALAGESLYARIVELVRTAQASKAPIQRMADRYAVWFTPLTLVVCAVAYFASRDPVRVLAVLVVATPCPLILAAPVAVIGGMNRAARRQIVVRHGTALEQLGLVTVAMFDKTGTLTIGRPEVARVVARAPFSESELLALAGAVEQGSSHLLARSLVTAAIERTGALPRASQIVEAPGAGVTGRVNGRDIAVGGHAFIQSRMTADVAFNGRAEAPVAALRAWVAVDGGAAGYVEFADQLRPEAARTFRELRRLGIRRTALISGDHAANVRPLARMLGIDDVRADLLPDEKVALVDQAVRRGERVLMVGDGTNDAPALSAATVGLAMAAHGGGITAEAADVVVLADDLERVPEAIAISRRTLRITRQSIWAGLGLSGLAMAFAAAGLIPPTAGALLQEVIDVAVILNALRAAPPLALPSRALA